MGRFMQIVRSTSCVAIVILAVAPALRASSRQLIEAAQQNDVAAVRALLEQPGVDVSETQPDGATALHWAAHRNSAELVEVLIEAGADANATNEYGVTPLSLAAQNGGLAALEHLIKAGANVDGALPSGETPLMTAARVGAGDVVKSLLDHGADVNLAEQLKAQTALMWALSEQHIDVARLLVERGANVRAASSSGFTPLLFAARMCNLEAVQMLLAAGSHIEEEASNGGTPLLVATLRGHADLAMYFLEQGADANTNKAGFTPLHWAVGNWETQTTHDYPDAVGEWEALGGIKKGRIELIHSLIAHGADVNARIVKSPPRFGFHMFMQIKVAGGTPFWIAALSADVDVMRLLAASGADTNAKSDDGSTPLMVAAGVGRVAGDSLIPERDSVAATQLCIDFGNEVNAQNNTGYTALHGTAFYGLDDVAELLVANGADMDIKNKKGETPLRMAEGTVNQAMLISHPSTAAVFRRLAAEKAARGVK